MAETLITEHLDIWTSAIKQKSSSGRGSSKKFSLHGIKKLRELILELAVRGKLVPQASREARNSAEYEPASVLLERIAAEKVQLVKDKKIKKPKDLPEIREDEKPFELPQAWEWTRFGACVEINSGNSFTKTEELNEGQYIYCKVGDMNLHGNETSITTSNSFINPNDKQLKSLILSGSIIFPKRGGAIATNKKRYVNKDIFADSNVMAVKPFSGASVEYVMLWLSSFDLASLNTGTSVPQINNKDIEPLIFTVPPLEEQHRIVVKVDELMSLCDALEAQTEASLLAHQTLVEVLLNSLIADTSVIATIDGGNVTESKNFSAGAIFDQNWQSISEHFDTLFTTSASIDTLKQTILQLAVMGKLVPQNPSDEPASVLLEKIAEEKVQLIADKKIKKQKPLPAITDEEKPFKLSEGWIVSRLGHVINLVSGQHLKPSEYSEEELIDGVPYITGPAEFGEVHPQYSKYTLERRALAKSGDILITCKGAGLGKLNRANKTIAISRQLMAIQSILVDADYLYLLLNSSYDYFQGRGVGIAIPGMSREDVTEMIMQLPPLAEQHRIVAKVDELMALCEQLKARLSDAQTTQAHLTDAIVENAV